MKEIELKFRVNDIQKLEGNLISLGCEPGECVEQRDTIYVIDLNNTESVEGSIWLRLRKQNERIELNCKKQSRRLQESQEIEFCVDSYEKANDFLEALGYKKWVEVNKKRKYSKYLDYNLCIDEVERLGTFIEIEILVGEKDNDDYIKKIMEVAKKIGLGKEDIINSHYDTMISELQ